MKSVGRSAAHDLKCSCSFSRQQIESESFAHALLGVLYRTLVAMLANQNASFSRHEAQSHAHCRTRNAPLRSSLPLLTLSRTAHPTARP